METELSGLCAEPIEPSYSSAAKLTNYLLVLVSLFSLTRSRNLDNNPFSSDINFSLISRVVFNIFQRRKPSPWKSFGHVIALLITSNTVFSFKEVCLLVCALLCF